MVTNTAMKPGDHAGVYVPPPLIFAAPLLMAALVHARQPWLIATANPSVFWIASFFAIAAAVSLGLASVVNFRHAGTTILPAGRPTTAVVDNGPYRFTRNPIYLAMALAYLGIALLLNNMWALVPLPIVLLIVDRFVIRREERYLAAKFGDSYQQYCSRVRRWC